jgi:hypothetical protein
LSVEREVSPPAPSGLGRPRTCPQDLSPRPPLAARRASGSCGMREMLAPHGTRSLVRLHGQSIPRLEASRRLTAEPDSRPRGASRRDARLPFQARRGSAPSDVLGRDRLAILLCSLREGMPAADLGPARAASGALLIQMLHAHTNAAIQADRDRGLLGAIACAFMAVHRDRCLLVGWVVSWSNGLGPRFGGPSRAKQFSLS